MSRNAFPQLEREYNERIAQREYAADEREEMLKWNRAYSEGHSKGWWGGWKAHGDAVFRAYKAGIISEETYDAIADFMNKENEEEGNEHQ